MTGVKLSLRQLETEDVDVAGQAVVDLSSEHVAGDVGDDVEMRNLLQRMHAGVGSSRAVELELPLGRDVSDNPCELALDRPRVLLDLPAAVSGAGVLDEQLEPGHATSVYLDVRVGALE